MLTSYQQPAPNYSAPQPEQSFGAEQHQYDDGSQSSIYPQQHDPNDPMGYLHKIPDILKQYAAPYSQMMSDPSGIMSKFGSQYTPSPGYKYELGQEEGAIGRAAAAGGMAGSPMQQQEAAKSARGLASQDYYNYLNHAMNLYMGGVHGYSGLGGDLSRNLLSEASLSQTQREEEQRQKEFKEAQDAQSSSSLWKALGTLGGGAAGFLFGGPAGAVGGAKIGSSL